MTTTTKATKKFMFILSKQGSWIIMEYFKIKKHTNLKLPLVDNKGDKRYITEINGKRLYSYDIGDDPQDFSDYSTYSKDVEVDVEVYNTDKIFKFNTLKELISDKEIFPLLLKGHFNVTQNK